jgi:hypothetical protein
MLRSVFVGILCLGTFWNVSDVDAQTRRIPPGEFNKIFAADVETILGAMNLSADKTAATRSIMMATAPAREDVFKRAASTKNDPAKTERMLAELEDIESEMILKLARVLSDEELVRYQNVRTQVRSAHLNRTGRQQRSRGQ